MTSLCLYKVAAISVYCETRRFLFAL